MAALERNPISRIIVSSGELHHELGRIADDIRFGEFDPQAEIYELNPVAKYKKAVPVRNHRLATSAPIIIGSSIESGTSLVLPLETDIFIVDTIEPGASIIASYDTSVFVGGSMIGQITDKFPIFRYVDPYTRFPYDDGTFNIAADKLREERGKLGVQLVKKGAGIGSELAQRKLSHIKHDRVGYVEFRNQLRVRAMGLVKA